MVIELKSRITQDDYTKYVKEAFDIQNPDETVVRVENNIKLDFDWNIGVIYGGSGSGKSTLLKTFGNIYSPEWNNDISLVSNFTWLKPGEVTQLLSAMGLASVPTWLRPHSALSNGEQYRANLAYAVSKASENEVILIDEYTSVVDRDVALAMSNALQKYIRKTHKKIILASCHFDIMDWLNPDWIYSPNKGRVERRDCLRLERPKIQLEIFRCRYETWKIFKHHHYLTDGLNPAAKCFIILWKDKPVAFMAIMPFPHGNIKNGFRISRIVVLPDYQGLGLGSKICDYFSSLYAKLDCTMYIKTSNPALWKYFSKSHNWELCGEIKRKELNSLKIENFRLAHDKSVFRNAITKSFKWKGYLSNDSTDLVVFNSKSADGISQLQGTLF